MVIPCLCSFTVPSSPFAEPPVNKKRTRTLSRKESGSSTNCMVGNNRPDIKGGNAHFFLLERGQAAEHFVVVFIHRVAVCDIFLEAFVKSFVLFLGLIRRQIQAGLLPGDISGIAQDRGLSLRLGHGFELL